MQDQNTTPPHGYGLLGQILCLCWGFEWHFKVLHNLAHADQEPIIEKISLKPHHAPKGNWGSREEWYFCQSNNNPKRKKRRNMKNIFDICILDNDIKNDMSESSISAIRKAIHWRNDFAHLKWVYPYIRDNNLPTVPPKFKHLSNQQYSNLKRKISEIGYILLEGIIHIKAIETIYQDRGYDLSVSPDDDF
ncbi:MAG: hypothetical protein OXF85_00390 [Candidatus Saccharibacteria bacterium]|nr:hypothetical protein [Candidatus Saccharibacteria bacterium]